MENSMAKGLIRWMIGVLASIAFTCAALQAQAQAPAQEQVGSASPASESKGAPPREWYGAPIVLTDLAALGTFFGGIVASDHGHDFGVVLSVVGAGTYLLGGPIIHKAEHQEGKSLASLGLRAGASGVGVVLGAVIGGVIGSEGKNGCGGDGCGVRVIAMGVVGGLVGFGSGCLVAAVVDSAVLAYKPTTVKPLAVSVTPIYQPATHQTGLALRGTW
jgi:hypothetical protein